MTSETPQAPTFAPVRRVRSLDGVVEQLREALLAGRIRQGERLPGERELAQVFAVSRPTVREALRSLEAVGVLEIRPGKAGGAFAVVPSSTFVGDAISTLLKLDRDSMGDLVEFRLSFEPENAWWAAQRAEEVDLATLTAIVAQAKAAVAASQEWHPVGEVDARWHEAIAQATKNKLRIGISQGIHDAMMHQLQVLSPEAAPRYGSAIPRDLARITKAIRAGDADLARDAMRRHVERFKPVNSAIR